MNGIWLNSAAAAALMAALAMSTATQAQNDAAQDDGDIEVIRVYGEGLGRTLQETATSVAIIGEQTIEDANFDDYFDALRRVANVSSNNGELNFNIRGVGNLTNQTGGASNQGQPVSAVYIDGLVVPSDAFSLNLFPGVQSIWDVEQLEVYRGVQLTRGRQVPVGSVYIQTKNPTDEFEFDSRLIAAEYNAFAAAVSLSGPVLPAAGLTGRLAVEYAESDGAIDNITRGIDDADAQESLNIRGKLRWSPDFLPQLDATLSAASYQFDTGLDSVPLELFIRNDGDDRRQSVVNTIADRDYTLNSVQLNAGYDVNANLELDLLVGYIIAEEDSFEEIDYSDRRDFGQWYYEHPREEIFATELRGRFDYDRVFGAFGLYHEAIDSQYNLTLWFPGAQVGALGLDAFDFNSTADMGPLADFEIVTAPRVKQIQSTSVYADLFFPLMDDFLTLGGGLRVERFENETNIGTAPSANSFEQTIVSPKASVLLRWTEDFSTTISAARGYRPGFPSSFLNTATAEVDAFEADDEELWNYELAFRFQGLDGRLTANTNLFFIDWTNQTGFTEDDTGFEQPSNVGASEAYGLEIEAVYRPIRGLETFLTLGLLETEYTGDADGDDAGGVSSIVGNEFPKAPSYSGSVGATYRMLNGFFGSASVTFEDESFDNSSNPEAIEILNGRTAQLGQTIYPAVIDARTVVDVKAGWEGDNIAFYIFADNLLDEDYIDNISFRNQESFLYPEDATFAQVGDPRIVGVELRLSR